MSKSRRSFNLTVVLSAQSQTGGGYHQALTSLQMLLDHLPAGVHVRVLDTRGSFRESLRKLVNEGRLSPDDILSMPRRLPSLRDRIVVEKGVFFALIRWLVSLRGISIGASLLARYLDKSDTDLVYFVTPSLVAHELQIKPYVWTLWDLCHLDSPEFPEVRTSGKFEGRDEATSLCLRKASLIVVDSAELEVNARLSYGITASKFVTIPFAPASGISAPASDALLPQEVRQIAGKFVFYPAQLWTHKNHARIAEAIGILKERNLDIHAVFVGKDHGAGTSLRRLIDELGVADRVHFLGYVDDEVMPELYKASLGLVMASYFGPTNIPPLEAMMLRVPVIASHQHKSQLGESALLFDPDEADDLANAIESLSSPSVRKKLVTEGEKALAALSKQRENGYRQLSRGIQGIARRLYV